MRRMNSMLLGHQGASGAHRLHVLVDREPRRRIVPGQRQMHDAARHSRFVERAAARLAVSQQQTSSFAARCARES